MTPIEKVRSAIFEVMGRTGDKPTAVYLGQLDFRELLDDIRGHYGKGCVPEKTSEVEADTTSENFQFNGVPVFVLPGLRHFGIGAPERLIGG